MTIRITATSIGAKTVVDQRINNSPERWRVALYPEGDVILANAREPFTEAARQLVATGHDPKRLFLLVDPVTGNTRLSARLGKAAQLTVSEPAAGGGPKLVPYQPRPNQDVLGD